MVKAFLMEVHQTRRPGEAMRNPTWLSAEEAPKVLAKDREVKYARELQSVIDRALERLCPEKTFQRRVNESVRADSPCQYSYDP